MSADSIHPFRLSMNRFSDLVDQMDREGFRRLLELSAIQADFPHGSVHIIDVCCTIDDICSRGVVEVGEWEQELLLNAALFHD